MNPPEVLEAISKFRVLVAGDLSLDRFCTYDPALADESAETGIPRIAVVSAESAPAGAGVLANNLAALGAAEVAILGVAGYDGFGYELEGALLARRISCNPLVHANLPTSCRTRLVNARTGREDRPRVDFVHPQQLPDELERQLVSRLEEAAPNYDAVIVADRSDANNGGVVTPAFRDALARLAAENPHILFWADSQLRGEHFRRLVVKMTLDQARAASERALGELDLIGLRIHMESPLLVLTHGPRGALVIHRRGLRWVPADGIDGENVPENVPRGAGDSFSAAAALALRATSDPVQAAEFGNLVASTSIMKGCLGPASPDEVRKRASQPRIPRRSVPVDRIAQQRGPG